MAEQTGAGIGTILAVSQQPFLQRLWEKEFDVVAMGSLKMPISRQARALEVFLHLLGEAACSEPAWLLDPAFDGLLNEGERRLCDKLEELAVALVAEARAARAARLAARGCALRAARAEALLDGARPRPAPLPSGSRPRAGGDRGGGL